MFKYILAIALLFSLSPASSADDTITLHPKIKAVSDNKTFRGASSFALGVKSFPREDSRSGLGYNSFIRTIRKIATNELYTFPEKSNKDNIKNTIAELIANGHSVFHEIHVLNGPGIRGASDYFVNSLFNRKMYNKEFKKLLKTDSYTQQRVLKLFRRVVVHAEALQNLGAYVVICPELEDNEDNESYEILVKLLKKAGWKDERKMVRNSIYNAYPTRTNIRYEAHPHSQLEVEMYLNRGIRKGSILNTDGTSFRFNGETGTRKTISQEQIEKSITLTSKKGVIFFAWYSPLQGYDNHDQSYSGSYTDRNYTISKENRKNFGAILARKPVDSVFEN